MKLKSLNPTVILIVIIVIAVILRVVAVIWFGNQVVDLPGTNDQISYHSLAIRLVEGHGFSFGQDWWPVTAANSPTAHWSFLYTFYLALIYRLFGQNPIVGRLIQAVLVGILQPLLAFWIGRRLFGVAVGLVAAGISAIYIYFIYYSATLMTEPFYIISILAVLLLAMKWAAPLSAGGEGDQKSNRIALAFGLGLLLGATVLLRQLFLLVIPFIFAWIWWSRRRHGGRSAIPGLILAGFLVLLIMLPFTYYNYTRFQRFVLLNTNAGYAIFFGNHPIYGTHFIPIISNESGGYLSLIPKELLKLDEAALDQALLKRAIGFIADDPGRYLLLSLSRIPVYFIFWPSADSGLVSNLSRVASFGLFLPFMLYGLILSILSRYGPEKFSLASPVCLLVLFGAVYTLIHLLTWTLVRYRLPVDAVLVIFAGVALVDLASRIESRLARKSVQSELPGDVKPSSI